MKPICVPCQRFYRPIKNDFYFIQAMPTGYSDVAFPGRATPDQWRPYKIWAGDKWRCPDCGAEIVVGCSREPIAERYQPEFDKTLAALRPELQVNDC